MGTPDVCKVVAGVAVGVHKLSPYKANFCKISRLCGAVSSLLVNKIILKLGNFIGLKALFAALSTNFRQLAH